MLLISDEFCKIKKNHRKSLWLCYTSLSIAHLRMELDTEFLYISVRKGVSHRNQHRISPVH